MVSTSVLFEGCAEWSELRGHNGRLEHLLLKLASRPCGCDDAGGERHWRGVGARSRIQRVERPSRGARRAAHAHRPQRQQLLLAELLQLIARLLGASRV